MLLLHSGLAHVRDVQPWEQLVSQLLSITALMHLTAHNVGQHAERHRQAFEARAPDGRLCHASDDAKSAPATTTRAW